MKKYAGIGSRSTPSPLLLNMELFAEKLSSNYILRTGGAEGADTAFIRGAMRGNPKSMEIYIPFNGFNGFNSYEHNMVFSFIPDEAFKMAKKFHPKYEKLKKTSKKLMARNCLQIFGENLNDPVDFIICYTHDGKDSGGTGQALRIANEYNIKVYNLFYSKDFKTIKKLIDSPKIIS